MKHIILTTLLLVFGLSLNAQNTSNPIKFRTEHSELVIEGKVMECRSFWNESSTQILTSNLVEVFKVFKGKDFNKETIEIITLGGTVGDRFSIVSHQKTFKPGMEGIFFCKANQKLSSMQQSGEASFVLSFPETGFVQYFFEKFNHPAADARKSYKDIPKEIYGEIVLSARESVRRIKANTVEEKLQSMVNILPDAESLNTTAITFSFENVSLTNNFQNISFDVYVKSSENGLRFGKALVLIKYSSEVFGESVVANQNISVSKGTVLQNSAYSISESDQDTEKLLLDVTSNFLSPSDAYALTTVPEQFCHIDLTIENFFALANIGFDDFQMSGNSWYYEPSSNEYILFDRVAVENPIIKSNVEDPAFIFYHLDSICVTSDATKMYLEYDISASSNVTWTRLSIADIFISFNTLGFGNPSNATITLYPEFSNLGYTTNILPYDPENLFQVTIAQSELDDSTKHVPIGLDPKRIGRLKMEIKDCSENAGIYFVDTLMNGLQFYFGGVPIPLIAYDFGEEGNADYYDQFLCIPNAPIITKIYPKDLSAGIRDTLTIEGKGFKTDAGTGSVFFRDAGFTDTTVFNHAYIEDYILYTDTLIKLYVPSSLVDSDNGAASGKVKVENNLNGIATSDDPINIIFSVTNVREPDTAYRISFINQNGLGGYTFEMDYQLELEGAGPCIKKAVETWRCLTNVNWSFIDSALVNTQFSSNDGKCVVFIGDTIPPDSSGGFLMRTYLSGYRKICNTGSQEVYYIDNMDVEVNPFYTFAYDCSDIDTVGAIHDFYSILLHELGHCHMLLHNVENNEIMFTHWNEFVDEPDFNDIAGGKNVIEFSLDWNSTGSCSSISIHDTVSCKTNFVFEHLDDELPVSIFPNPFLETFNVKIDLNTLLSLQIDVRDVAGRSIFSKNVENAEQAGHSVSISLGNELPPGPYIIRITTKNSSFSTIIIKG
ncbi:MAG: T9SS type A sorting domain-containing protein [Lewinellaceae bacterium]|nr:T9SS type A sorting domain-containing protein [Lewinellaceae bacterium]